MRRKRMLWIGAALILLLQMLLPLAAPAQEAEGKVVRVGWYESAFHRTDAFGRRSGYGYEYQQRIAVYTGWTYEYVEGSWSELFEMLVAGEIDLLSDVSYTPARAEQILFSAEGMGSEDFHVFITPDNTEIRPDDFSTFNGKRVGVNKNSIQEQLFTEWARSHEVEPEITELTGKTAELLDMLARGEIDALVTLDTYGNSANVIPVCKIGSADSYFGINKNRPDVKQDLDVAMNRLLETNRDFNQIMTEKYHQSSAVNSFLSTKEKDWLAEHGTIRVGYQDDFLPFSDLDEEKGSLSGALSEYLAFAATCEKNAELSFETRDFDSTEDALNALAAGEIDCVFPVTLSAYDGEKRGVIMTEPFVSTEMYAIVRKADQLGVSPERPMRVAVRAGQPSHETFLKDHFPNWTMIYYNDSEEAFRAVAGGDADCCLVSNYRLNRVSDLCARYNLIPLTTGETMDQSFALRRSDDCLYSIFNKVTAQLPDATINASLTNFAFMNDKVTFRKFLRDNLPFVITALAIVVSVILGLILRSMRAEARASKGQQLISETERDPLTGLYNRGFFMVYANQLYRDHPERKMDAIVLNVERFHTLNTLNGRSFGDEVLRTLGEEITEFLHGTAGIAARPEADHFDVFCEHTDNYQALLDRFQAGMDEISRNGDIMLRMGVMPWTERLLPEQQFDRAWLACSMIRGNFKSHLMIYDEKLRERDEYNQRLQNDLGRALEERELEVYYQPKFDIQSDPPRLHSAEALVRWNHKKLGMIPPSDYITLFEQNGQISLLDHYVWEEAARQIAAWRDQYGTALPISVNLSRVDVFDPKLESILEELVRENHLDRKDLNLEITESAYTENADQLIQIIGRLREKGYEIEMDDFGSGYSSLNMLSSMPIDVLKMDIAFIRNIDRNERDFRLVELILDIAQYLKVPVVAEGVESEKQLKLLKDAGCDLVQGYVFSKPLPAKEFEQKILAPARKK